MAGALSKVIAAIFKKLKSTGVKIVSQIEAKLSGKPSSKRIVSYHEEDAVSLPKSRSGNLQDFAFEFPRYKT